MFFGLMSYCFGQSSQQATIQGTVSGQDGKPLEFVHVYIKEGSAGTVTNNSGEFILKTKQTGAVTLAVSLLGFRNYTEQLNLEAGEHYDRSITLKEALLDLGNAQITASAFTTGDVESVTLSPIEVVTTPGAAADVFRAFQTFPGVSSVNEGSGLFVRGGDVSETKILLDQATVIHPYKYETPTGGIFGTIPPFLVSGTFFSTGGFPARYGNALSGVLSMQSLGMPEQNTIDLNLGLAAASAQVSTELIPGKLGVNMSGNQSFTKTMFELNGQANQFHKAPSSTDFNINAVYKPSAASTIKAFTYLTKNQVGVTVDEPSYQGNYTGDESNQLYNMQWSYLFDESSWLMKNSFSLNRFSSTSAMGVLDMTEKDETYKFRSDWERPLSDMLKLYTGGEAVHQKNIFTGRVPQDEEILGPDASFYQLDENYGSTRLAGYTELDIQPGYRWLINMGIRTDYYDLSESLTADPRLTVQYQLNKRTNVRVSTGLYHQYPQPYQFNTQTGNPELGPQQAVHYILGFEHENDLLHFRAEAYYKDYDQLVIEDEERQLTNRGYGDARGVDLFLRYSRFLQSRFNGWISYSFLQSERYQPRQTESSMVFESTLSDFDITHNLNVVGKFRIVDMIYGGLNYQYATGRPFTPVVDAYQPSGQNYYLPVEGPVNSKRLPDFHRLDLNLSYYLPLPKQQSITFYVSVSNVLNYKNINDYTYNNDYSNRSPVYSNYNRFFYAGVTANLNL